LERLVMAVKSKRPDVKRTNTSLYLIPIGEAMEPCLKIAHDFRNCGINTDIEFEKKKVGKSIAYADSKGIPYVGMLGENEIAQKRLTIKDLKQGTQYNISFDEVPAFLKNK